VDSILRKKMNGIEREGRAIEQEFLKNRFLQMTEKEIDCQADMLQEKTVDCLINDDLFGAKYYLSQFLLCERLLARLTRVDLIELHEQLKLNRGKYNGACYRIIDQIQHSHRSHDRQE